MIGLKEKAPKEAKVVGLIATLVVKTKKPGAKPALHVVEAPEKRGQNTLPADQHLQHVERKATMEKNLNLGEKDE